MQNRELVLDHLRKYETDELIYKKYYELQGDPAAQKEYTDSLDPALVLSHSLLFPGYPGIKIPSHIKEDAIDGTDEETRRAVILTKHLRYTPVFSHSHDYFEIVYLLEGSCRQTLGGENLPLHAGDLCFIPPFTEHTLEIFDDSIAVNIILRRSTFEQVFFRTLRRDSVLTDFFVSGLCSRHPMRRIVFPTGDDEDIRDLVLQMYMEFTEGDEYSSALLENMVPILFSLMLRRFSRTASVLPPQEGSSPQALKLLQYIRVSYRDITLRGLADHFHYSASHCSRLIRKETGQSFTSMVRHIRVQQALSLLSSASRSVAQTAADCGYESTETFIRAFEKEMHMTPSAWRKRQAVQGR